MPLSRPKLALVPAITLVLACSGGGSSSPDLTGPQNSPPVFTLTPLTTADHNRPYEYSIVVSDPDGDAVTITVDQKPDWMAFDSNALVLSGIAGWENVGNHPVRIRATDGNTEVAQIFSVAVQKGEIICDQPFGDPAESLYTLPYQVGTTYRLEQGYCPPNPTWGHHDWFAYDFDTAIGDTIVASREGTVLFTREHNADGTRICGQQMENFVFIQHADGTVMQYVHLTTNGALVDVGDVVEQGQPIGLSGDSGCSAGPHVHVNLFRDATDFGRKATLPYNYRNTEGPVDGNDGLVFQANYEALAFTRNGG